MIIGFLACMLAAGHALVCSPPEARAAGGMFSGLGRAFSAVSRSRRLQSTSTQRDPRNSVAHQMLWGGPGFPIGR